MALTKTVLYDQVQIIGEYKVISIREATIISEDGVKLSETYHMDNLAPSDCSRDKDEDGVPVGTFTHTPTDITGQTAEIQAICNAVWTDEVKASYKTHLEATCI